MRYNEAITWLYCFEKYGIKLGLERIYYICEKLGNPQNNYKTVHVGGTNGKGSVCKIISSILNSAGYTVGVYTSPHIQRFSERFVIDNDEISEIDIVLLVEKVKPIVEEMIKNNNIPTFFEITTAMALEYFFDKKVDYAVIEVGLGGRFDATNIVNPLVSVITNVTLEHQDRLGKTVEEISFEKAGIIKENTHVITAAENTALDVIKKKAYEKNASLTVVDKISWEKTGGNLDWQKFTVHGKLKDYFVKTYLSGIFQGENLALSLMCIESLQMKGVYITDENIKEGVENTTNPGRMEILGSEPIILIDGAHNIAGMQMLKNTIKKDFFYAKLILVIGILSDKNVKEMVEIISPVADKIIVTKSSNIRASDPKMLKEFFKPKTVTVKNHVSEAVKYAKKIAKKQDIIVITGSLFTVGEARDALVSNLQKC
ncbi:MAG: bifunctional folylpolyglutamate synthase/dihydrofolate synthase [Candidatus Thermoplasmatota archaeon]|nr:bifunctional folylpolyglutamate synthase/dihydrofolate synthase [Candidatus Thermoplasmatota archaeon]